MLLHVLMCSRCILTQIRFYSYGIKKISGCIPYWEETPFPFFGKLWVPNLSHNLESATETELTPPAAMGCCRFKQKHRCVCSVRLSFYFLIIVFKGLIKKMLSEAKILTCFWRAIVRCNRNVLKSSEISALWV